MVFDSETVHWIVNEGVFSFQCLKSKRPLYPLSFVLQPENSSTSFVVGSCGPQGEPGGLGFIGSPGLSGQKGDPGHQGERGEAGTGKHKAFSVHNQNVQVQLDCGTTCSGEFLLSAQRWRLHACEG